MSTERMRVAYADPPYIGLARYYRDHPDYGGEVDHAALIERLLAEFADGWVLHCHSNALRTLLPLCPEQVRVLAWLKPFCSWKPDSNPVYTWEPVLLVGGRARSYRRGGTTVRDHLSESMAMRRGLVGAKPEAVCFWLFEALGLTGDDELVDLYPGTGGVTRAWERWRTGMFTRRVRG